MISILLSNLRIKSLEVLGSESNHSYELNYEFCIQTIQQTQTFFIITPHYTHGTSNPTVTVIYQPRNRKQAFFLLYI